MRSWESGLGAFLSASGRISRIAWTRKRFSSATLTKSEEDEISQPTQSIEQTGHSQSGLALKLERNSITYDRHSHSIALIRHNFLLGR